uniref:Uncharacterized protein n=1 Tax=Physcomitrium patens TaxID=3218 RepID=A0A2K1IHA1_PHYPA|nr:hypothetical protein PHYPA_029252 [Physcomitrium patens]
MVEEEEEVSVTLSDNEREHAGMLSRNKPGCVLACPFPLSPTILSMSSLLLCCMVCDTWCDFLYISLHPFLRD